MNSIFCSPSRYTQGPDATRELGKEMQTLCLEGPVCIVTSASPKKELESTWKETLSEAGFGYCIHDFCGECTASEVNRIVSVASASHCKTILGAGGGKVLDAARAAAADLGLPCVTCPTIASTDAPCSAISIIYTEEGVVERIRIHGHNPALVLVDSKLILRAPVRTLIAGMGDALSTVFEARACVASGSPNTRGGACTRAALALAELCYRTLIEDGVEALRAVNEQRITPAFERIIEANTLLSGLGFESAGLAAAHSTHNGLTVAPGTHHYLHGEKVAFGVLVQLMLEKAKPALVEEVLGFCQKVGLPVSLAEIGCGEINDQMLDAIADRAVIPGESIHNEPFAVSAGLVREAILAANAVGVSFHGKQH